MSTTILSCVAVVAIMGVGLWLLDILLRDYWHRKCERYVAEGHTRACAAGMTLQRLKCECDKDPHKE